MQASSILSPAVIFLLLASTATADQYKHIPRRVRGHSDLHAVMVNQFLGPHNAARAAAGEERLVWDTELESYAKSYAEQRRGDCALQHSNGPYGENLFWGGGSGWSPVQAVADWVAERKSYHYQDNSCDDGAMCGHYTQVVWSETRSLGCARIDCDGGLGVFMICNYDP